MGFGDREVVGLTPGAIHRLGALSRPYDRWIPRAVVQQWASMPGDFGWMGSKSFRDNLFSAYIVLRSDVIRGHQKAR